MKPNRTTCFLSQEAFDRIKSNYSKFNEPWQDSEIEELKTMAADQVPFEQIANQLQRTPNSVKMKLKSLGLYTPKPMPGTWRSDDEARLIEMYTLPDGNRTDIEDWYKVRGTATVTNGIVIYVNCEIHWYQCRDIGKVEFKVKVWGDKVEN